MDEDSWEKLWLKSKGSVYQSLEWMKAKKLSGENPMMKTVGDKEITAGLLVFEKNKKIPFFGTKKVLFSEGNPLILKKGSEKELFSKLKKDSKKYFYFLISPTITTYSEETFNKNHFKKTSNFTMLVDLSKTEGDLWKQLEKKSIRRGVNYAKKNGLEFQGANESDLRKFYNLYKNTAESGQFEPENEGFIELLRETNISRLFVIKRNNKIIAGGLILLDKNNNYSILNLTASSEEGNKFQAMPFLYWNLILFSKSLGLKYFDLGGFDMEANLGDKTYNINKFKERFGAEIKEQPIYSTSKKYKMIRNLLKRIKFLKKMYKK